MQTRRLSAQVMVKIEPIQTPPDVARTPHEEAQCLRRADRKALLVEYNAIRDRRALEHKCHWDAEVPVNQAWSESLWQAKLKQYNDEWDVQEKAIIASYKHQLTTMRRVHRLQKKLLRAKRRADPCAGEAPTRDRRGASQPEPTRRAFRWATGAPTRVLRSASRRAKNN